MLLDPAGAVALASLFLGERLSGLDWAGVILLAMSLILIFRRDSTVD